MDNIVEMIKQAEFLKRNADKVDLFHKEYLLACSEDDKKTLDRIREDIHSHVDLGLDLVYTLLALEKKAKDEALRSMLRGRKG